MNTADLFYQFHKSWSAINAAYEEYTRELGISYSMLQVLCELYNATEVMTQKAICDVCHLPKTTVNAMISGLVNQGYVELREMAEDRRQKAVHLTEAGMRYAEPMMSHMRESEIQAFEMLDEETVSMLLKGMEAYQKNFHEKLNLLLGSPDACGRKSHL